MPTNITIITLTENQEKFIRENCNRRSIREMAEALRLSKWRVGEWMRQNNVAPKKQLCKAKKDHSLAKEGMFDWSEKDNWLI